MDEKFLATGTRMAIREMEPQKGFNVRQMKVGDLVFVDGYEVGIVMAEPRLSEDCKQGGEAYPYEYYHYVSVLTQSGILEDFEEEDLEVIHVL